MNLKAAPDVALVILNCFGQTCTAHAHKLLILASDQNSDIAIRLSDEMLKVKWSKVKVTSSDREIIMVSSEKSGWLN